MLTLGAFGSSARRGRSEACSHLSLLVPRLEVGDGQPEREPDCEGPAGELHRAPDEDPALRHAGTMSTAGGGQDVRMPTSGLPEVLRQLRGLIEQGPMTSAESELKCFGGHGCDGVVVAPTPATTAFCG